MTEVCPEEVDEYALYSRYSVPETKKKTKGRSVSICREAPMEEMEEEEEEEKKGWTIDIPTKTVILMVEIIGINKTRLSDE